jgi:AraC-like DNA-binding protein
VLIDARGFARLCQVRGVLCDLREAPPSLAALAAGLGVSQFHLIRQFRAAFGTTPRQAQIDARLELARRLLASGGHSVTEACLEVGFTSLGSFSSLFRRRVGTTPADYRRRARRMVSVPGGVPPDLFPGCLSLMARLPVA